MQKIILLLSVFLAIAVISNAQVPNAQQKKDRVKNYDSTKRQDLKDKGITKDNLKDLNLSKDQQKQIDDIHTNARKQKEQIKNDPSLTEEQKQEKMKQVDQDSKNKMNGILTKEQKDKIKNKRANSKDKSPGTK